MFVLTNNTENTIYLTLEADNNVDLIKGLVSTGYTMDLVSDLGNNSYTGITLQEIVYTGDTSTRFNAFNITLTANTAVDYDNGLVWVENEGYYHYTCYYKQEQGFPHFDTYYGEVEKGKCIISGSTYNNSISTYEYVDNDDDSYFIYEP